MPLCSTLLAKGLVLDNRIAEVAFGERTDFHKQFCPFFPADH